jgi:hypothetical protein
MKGDGFKSQNYEGRPSARKIQWPRDLRKNRVVLPFGHNCVISIKGYVENQQGQTLKRYIL